VEIMTRITTGLTAIAVALVAIAGPIAWAKPAHAAAASDEQAFASAVNGVRAAHGVAPLAVDARLTSLGEYWAGHMASSGALSHNPSMTSMFPAGWTKIGENVGEGPSAATVEQALEQSAPHLANMLDPAFTSFGVGVVWSGSTLWVSEEFMAGGPPPITAATARGFAGTADGKGYWAAASNGNVGSFGDAVFHGSLAGVALARPIVGMASTPSGAGYWLVATDGGIFSFGDAAFHGSTGAIRLNRPIVGMASTPSGQGYWMVASDGGIFTFGDAGFYGSTGAIRLNQPIVGMAATPSGHGYWLVASDGGIFSFGDAAFYGSTGAIRLNQPVVSMAAAPGGAGYWLVASDGGVFSFGTAPFHGSLGGSAISAPVVSVTPAVHSSSGGYWMLGVDGKVYAFGGAVNYGSMSL
jgi:ribosomal protein L24E